MIRRRYRYVGHVQGVGMRFLCKVLAEEQGCTGWVYNELDGSVTAEFQGEPASITAVLAGLAERFNGVAWLGGFDVASVEELPLVASEEHFTIR